MTRVRDSTGAMVRVLEQNKGQRRLESGEEVDEVIEIQGFPQSCDSALQAVADLLRQYQVSPSYLSAVHKTEFDRHLMCPFHVDLALVRCCAVAGLYVKCV